jgi:predicted ATPase
MQQSPSDNLTSLNIPTGLTTTSIEVFAGQPVFILGRNGTGKSALVHTLRAQIGERVVYLPGSRPTYFENESLSLTPASRRNLMQSMTSWDSSPDTRWRSISGTSRNEKAIHDLHTAETQYKIDAANEIKREGSISRAVARLQSNSSPLDRVNALMSQANLPVRMLIDGGELKAQQTGNIYSYAKMSDGERSALILAAEVIAAEEDSIFLVDEPELHLHPSIVVPLLNALIAERPGCGFVICTHELDLASSSPSAQVVLVRSYSWEDNSFKSWEIDVLTDSSQIPDSLRADLMGSRRKILFIEGTSNSLDQPLYELLFPAVSVRTRENCREVMRAVSGLRSVETLHRVEAFGLVDHDGMGEERSAELEAEGIYPLPIFAVESLYYSGEAISAVAAQQSATFGISTEVLLSEAKSFSLAALSLGNSIEHLASRIAERQLRDKMMLSLPDRQSMISGTGETISVSLPSPYPTELMRIRRLIDEKNIDGIVARYPVRESGVLNSLAKGLHFSTRQDYERAALTRIGADENLRSALKAKLGTLASHLEEQLTIQTSASEVISDAHLSS